MTDVSNRNRVQSGVPTGGEFATEQKGENADLSTIATLDSVCDMTYEKDRAEALIDMYGIAGSVEDLGMKTPDYPGGNNHPFHAWRITATNPTTGATIARDWNSSPAQGDQPPSVTDLLVNEGYSAERVEEADGSPELWATSGEGYDEDELDGAESDKAEFAQSDRERKQFSAFMGRGYGPLVFREVYGQSGEPESAREARIDHLTGALGITAKAEPLGVQKIAPGMVASVWETRLTNPRTGEAINYRYASKLAVEPTTDELMRGVANRALMIEESKGASPENMAFLKRAQDFLGADYPSVRHQG